MRSEEEVGVGKSVLIVEDEPLHAQFIAILVEAAGFSQAQARHGQEALDLLRDGLRPDLILLDIRMPVMDGWQFLAAIQGDVLFGEIPVVMLTSLDDPELVRRATQCGAVGYCTKPIDVPLLMETLHRVLA